MFTVFFFKTDTSLNLCPWEYRLYPEAKHKLVCSESEQQASVFCVTCHKKIDIKIVALTIFGGDVGFVVGFAPQGEGTESGTHFFVVLFSD